MGLDEHQGRQQNGGRVKANRLNNDNERERSREEKNGGKLEGEGTYLTECKALAH